MARKLKIEYGNPGGEGRMVRIMRLETLCMYFWLATLAAELVLLSLTTTLNDFEVLGVQTVLLQHPGRLVTGRHILQQVWGPGHEDSTNYLRVYFAGLRRKLEREPARPRHLLTEPGMGYRFEP